MAVNSPRCRVGVLALGGLVLAAVVLGAALEASSIDRDVPAATIQATAGGGHQTGESVRAGAVSGAHRTTTLARSLPGPAAAVGVPALGIDLGPTIRTCTKSRSHGTPATSALCAAWEPSGPVNVVIVSTVGDPYQLLMRGGAGWHPALGGWLVASGDVLTGGSGCALGWRGSTQQVELRIDRTNRRHFKFIAACGAAGTTVVFGEAHTDNFDLRSCGGDHMTELDAARTALVAAYRALPGVTVTVSYRQGHPATQSYPGGCGRSIPSDGRVAYVAIAIGI